MQLKTTLRKQLFFAIALLYSITPSFAQWDDVQEGGEEFRDFLGEAAPIAFVCILLLSGIFNIGKIMGDNKDYKGFFIGIALYILGLSVLAGAITWVASMSF